MLRVLLTPLSLSLRRIPFVCGACILLFTACGDIPDQDACIEIDAVKNDRSIFTVDTTKAYDTIASTIQCNIRYKDGSVARNWPVSFFIDSAETKEYTDTAGRTSPIWVAGGTYSLGVGVPSEYPCIIIHNLSLPGGRGFEINITLPSNE